MATGVSASEGEIEMSQEAKNGLGCLVVFLAIVGLIFLGRFVTGADAPPAEGNACSTPGETVTDEQGNEFTCR